MKGRNAFAGVIMDVDLRLLRVFLNIVNFGGITQAALELNIDRSTVSKHLSDLETRLGMRLCERGRQGFSLTPFGEQVHLSAQELMTSIDGFASAVAGYKGHLNGSFNFAFADGSLKNPEAELEKAFDRFCRIAPEVHVTINVCSANEIERGVIDGKYHVGLAPFHHSIVGLRHKYLFSEEAKLYCAEGHPLFGRAYEDISLKDIRQSSYVSWGYFIDKKLINRTLEFTPCATVVNNEGAAALILSGQYIGFLPVHYAQPWVSANRLRALAPDIAYYKKPMSLIFKTDQSEQPLITAFIDAATS
ncbi:LysR family transcriptional regulator [Hoeflea sp.]|uniref:LysR family transcriptional regulator n=1 Tax=Hoeflea sp. TaxID=1940281 RepID=UPI003B01748F